jgi:hypothetical protein
MFAHAIASTSPTTIVIASSGRWYRVRRANLRLNPAHGRCGIGERLSRLAADDHVQPPVTAGVEAAFLAANQRFGADRNRDVERAAHLEAEEVVRRDADDRERHALDDDRLADHAGRSAVAALPERVADDGYGAVGAAAMTVVVGLPRAAEDRLDAEHFEEAAARPQAIDEFRASALRQVEPRHGPGEGTVHDRCAVAHRFPDRIGELGARAVLAQHGELLGRAHR